MADIFDQADKERKENVQMKSGEITGNQHLFHSLPKEFQQWHATHYMLEKEGDVDENTVTASTLNAYMWKTLFDSTAYAIYSFFLIFSTVLIERFLIEIDNSFLFFLHWSYFLAISIFIGYHFVFYGIIRAQVIGRLTEQAAKNTSFMFYQTSSAIFFALIIAFLFIVTFAESVQELLFLIVVEMEGNDFIKDVLIAIHNIMNWFFYYNQESFMSNIYISTIVFSTILVVICWYIENRSYRNFRVRIIEAMSVADLKARFPIEKSQKVITAWRKKYEV